MKKLFTLLILVAILHPAFAQTVQTITTSGTFTVPPNVNIVILEVVGAGGSGGGNGTGGGGGGGYAMGAYPVIPGQVLNITIGQPGQNPSVGTTSVDNLISATGGANGVSVSNPNVGGGGAGGVGQNGNVANFTGGDGGGGYWTYFGGGGGGAAGANGNGGIGGNTIPWSGICQTPGGAAGISGGAPGGDGGKGAGFTDINCNVTDPAGNGLNYGGGGGGGNGNGGGPGSGAPGVCVITYFANCLVDTTVTVSGDTLTSNDLLGSYQWIDCNTLTDIPGETNAQFVATQTGNYAVVIDNGICSDTSACYSVTICTLDTTVTITQGGDSLIANQQTGSYQWIDCINNVIIQGATNPVFVPTQSGSYQVVLQDGICIGTSACLQVTVCNLDSTVTTSGDSIIANQSGATYQWFDCVTNIALPNATNQVYVPTANGSYFVQITLNNCVSVSECTTVTGFGIDNSNLNPWMVYPNPFTQFIQVENGDGSEVFELYATTGQLIWKGKNIQNHDFSALVSGIYTLKISTESRTQTLRVTKK